MSTSQHRKHRGMRTQKLVAQYLAGHGWPFAESAGAGRNGSDVTGTIDIAVEVKARSNLDPAGWVRQAEQAAHGRLPIAVVRCNGQGEDAGQYVALVRFDQLVQLLREAGYGDGSVVSTTLDDIEADPLEADIASGAVRLAARQRSDVPGGVSRAGGVA